MSAVRPAFTERPSAYLITPRMAANPVRYACAMEDYKPPSSYGKAWWFAMVVIVAATIALAVR